MLSANKIDCNRHIKLVANICHDALKSNVFGYFEETKPVKFKKGLYQGVFRLAYDNLPFVEKYAYVGSESFDNSQPIIVNLAEKCGISLFPFYFWDENVSTYMNIRCFVFDKVVNGSCFFKSIDADTSLELNEEYADLTDHINATIEGSASSDILTIELSKIE